VVQTQRDAQLHHFESLDGRAGIVLGFSGAEPEFTKVAVVDAYVVMIEESRSLLLAKARRLSLAMAALVVAVLMVAVSIGLH
jgi:hypothetical protein